MPWYRVLSSSGAITIQGPGAQRQRDELEAEGVEVNTGRMGEMKVSLATWGWFPQVGSVSLPDDIDVPAEVPPTEND